MEILTGEGGLLCNPQRIQELDRLGDEIAELSAHLDAATARLLELIREFDRRGGWNTGFRSCAGWLTWGGGGAAGGVERARECGRRGGWNTGFRSCAEWLTWRVGLNPGAARERVRVARAL